MIDRIRTDGSDRGFGVSEFRRFDLDAAFGSRGASAADVAVLPYPDEAAPEPDDASFATNVGPSDAGTDDNLYDSPGTVAAASPAGVFMSRGASRGAALAVPRRLLTGATLVAADLLALVDSAVFGVLAVYALHALNLLDLPTGGPTARPWACVLIQLPLIFLYWRRGLYPGIGLHSAVELRQIAGLNTGAGFCTATALLAAGASAPSSAWVAYLVGAWLASLVLVPLARSLTRGQCARRAWWGCPAVVIGTGDAARRTTEALLARPQSGWRPVGVIDPDRRGAGSLLGIPYLRETGDAPIGESTSTPAATCAIVDLEGVAADRAGELLDGYRRRFPHLLVLPGTDAAPGLWHVSRDCGGGLAGTELCNRVLLPWQRRVKRATDVALTGTALALGLPLMAAVAVAVRLSSPGPVLFGHKRLGRDGRSFKAWKFRTMRADADKVLRELLASDPAARREWDLDHKLRDDPRVTRVGNLLRKTSLDELPQLWNVLRGDMSLVGPRPIVEAEVVKYGSVYRLYSQVPPGITGLWQVSGRNNTTYAERVGLDDYYVRNWSPWLDLHVLAKTVAVLITGDGAY